MHSFPGFPGLGLTIRAWGNKHTLNTSLKKSWRPVFKAWARIHFDYWTRANRDIGWWSSERANVSLLANAVWASGANAALQEYGDKKHKDGKEYSGRPDLYATIGEHEYIAEAKQCWPWIPGKVAANELWRARIRNSFAAAVEDAKNNVDYGIPRTALCFASPRIAKGHRDSADAFIANYLQADFELSTITSVGYRVDLFPLNQWKSGGVKFDLAACQSDGETPGAFFPGCTLLMGFVG